MYFILSMDPINLMFVNGVHALFYALSCSRVHSVWFHWCLMHVFASCYLALCSSINLPSLLSLLVSLSLFFELYFSLTMATAAGPSGKIISLPFFLFLPFSSSPASSLLISVIALLTQLNWCNWCNQYIYMTFITLPPISTLLCTHVSIVVAIMPSLLVSCISTHAQHYCISFLSFITFLCCSPHSVTTSSYHIFEMKPSFAVFITIKFTASI